MRTSWMVVFCLGLFTQILGEEEQSRRYKCPEGWHLFEEGGSCILVSKASVLFNSAKDACVDHGSSLITVESAEKNDFINNLLDSAAWIGLEKADKAPFRWISGQPTTFVDFGESPHLTTVAAGCVYIETNGKWYSTPDCEFRKLRYICEKEPDCADGRFGDTCEKECFCASKPCDPVTGTCNYGCEPGWTGPNCDEPKELVSAAYYCVKSDRLGRYVFLRMDTKGAEYADVNGMEASGLPAPDCLNKEFNQTQKIISFKLTLPEDENTTESLCGAEKLGEDSYKWRFWLQEVKGALSAHDQIIEASCDFADAETMERERVPIITNQKAPHVVVANQTRESVVLKLVDPFTNKEVTEAVIGTRLQLVMDLSKKEGLAATGISSYGCFSKDSNGTQRIKLTDFNGCPAKHSPITSFIGNGQHVETAIFPTFTFPKSDEVIFECSFEFCFDSNDDLCKNRCYFKTNESGRRKRMVQDEPKSLQTSLRVLAGGVESYKMASDKEEKSLLSLTPMTMTLIVVLCLLVLAVFAVVMFSMQRSVISLKAQLRQAQQTATL